MSTVNRLRPFARLDTSPRGWLLVTLFCLVIAGSITTAGILSSSDPSPTPGASITSDASPAIADASQSEQATGGIALALIEALFAGLLLLALAVWRYLPAWLQDTLKKSAKATLFLVVGAIAAYRGVLPTAIIAFATANITFRAIDHVGLSWLINNVLVLVVVIPVAAVIGRALPVVFFLAFFAGITIYDHVFANTRPWMAKIAVATIRGRLPALFIVPRERRTSWNDLVDGLVEDDKDEEDSIGFAIGAGDLLIPAAFTVSVAASSQHPRILLPLVGILTGVIVACFRLNYLIGARETAAGLPALATGSIGGWIVGWAVAVAWSGVLPA